MSIRLVVAELISTLKNDFYNRVYSEKNKKMLYLCNSKRYRSRYSKDKIMYGSAKNVKQTVKGMKL